MKRWPAACERGRAGRRRRPRRPGRSRACGRRPRRACRSPRPARACAASARRIAAQLVGRGACGAEPVGVERRAGWIPSAAYLAGCPSARRLVPRATRGRHPRRRAAADRRRRRQRQDAHARRPFRLAGRAGRGARGGARAGAFERAADALRRNVEDAVQRPYEELAVTTVHAFCARLLREEALAGGLDPFAVPVGRADRLAMLLERIDELTIRRHDFRGNAAGAGRRLRAADRPAQGRADRRRRVRRVGRDARRRGQPADRGRRLHGAGRRARGLRRGALARRPRARVRLDLPSARPDARRAGRARRRRPRDRRADDCCASTRTCERGSPAAGATCSSTTCRSRTSRTGCCCGCSPPSTAT